MAITGKTIYNQENLKTFQQVAVRYISPKFYGVMIAGYLLVGAVGTAIGLYYAAALIGGDYDIVTVILAAVGLYLGIQMLMMGLRYSDSSARQTMKRIPPEGRKVHFTFEEAEIVLRNRECPVNYPYDKFSCIYETQKYFLFYISATKGYILEKSGIVDGDPDQLRQLLNSRCPRPVIQLQDI